jgi:2,3-bisphosphoglycerate-dependent phosphoglycerate mutase
MGHRQARRLAEYLSRPGNNQATSNHHDPQNLEGYPLSHLYCSLMVRAVATGTMVADTLDLPLIAWPEIHETGGIHQVSSDGQHREGLPGRNRAFFETYYPNLVLPDWLDENGWWNRPFESREARPRRARKFWQELLRRHGETDDQVAIISHGGFYNHLMHIVLAGQETMLSDLPAESNAGLATLQPAWYSLNNVAITRIDVEEGWLWVQYMNRVGFLSSDMIS